ncbi:tetratricopeptide repeat protein [bacterium]|nr:tetratricopeptide repeat protein [bacterium]
MRKHLLIVPLLVLLWVIKPANVPALNEMESASKYNEAGSLYRGGKFKEALDLYEQLIGEGIVNPDLYYNASNAAYRNGALGKAILYLRRSLKLAPSDEDALTNLAFLNSIKQDKEPANDNPVVAFITGHYNTININTAALWSGISFLLAMVFATTMLFLGKLKRLTLIVVSALCGLVFFVSTGILVEKIHERDTKVEAVIMVDNANAYSGPGTDNTHIFTVHEGTTVTLERSQDEWNLVRLMSGAGGWIKAETMERI